MEIKVYFPGGKRVYADFKDFTVETDQPQAAGGEESAPSPFEIFLASLATCAGYYVLAFCQSRNIDVANIELTQKSNYNQQTHLIDRIEITIKLPPDFPEKYQEAVIAAAAQCTVKKHLQNPPFIELKVVAQ